MHVIFVLTLFVVKNFYVLEFNNCVCKFDKNKNKNLLKKKKNSSEFLKSLFLARNYFMWFFNWLYSVVAVSAS